MPTRIPRLGALVAATSLTAAQAAPSPEATAQVQAAAQAIAELPLLITGDHAYVQAFPGMEATAPNEQGTQFVLRPIVLDGVETTRALRVSFVDDEGTPWAFIDQSMIEVLQGRRMRVVRLDGDGAVLSDSQLQDGRWSTTFYMSGKPVPNQAERQAGPIHFHPMEYVHTAMMAADPSGGLVASEMDGKPALVSAPGALEPVTVTLSGGETFAMDSMSVGSAATGETVRRYAGHGEVLPGVAPLPTDIYDHQAGPGGAITAINQFQDVTYRVLQPGELDALLAAPVEELVVEASKTAAVAGE